MTIAPRSLFSFLTVLMLVSGWFVPSLEGQTSAANPAARAGSDQVIDASGALVRLDGSGSIDSAGRALSYLWTLVEAPTGSSAALADAHTATPTFVADRPGRYVAQLVVGDDSRVSDPDLVVVLVRSAAPTADAGIDLTGAVGTIVRLDGTGSSDPERGELRFRWSFVSRP